MRLFLLSILFTSWSIPALVTHLWIYYGYIFLNIMRQDSLLPTSPSISLIFQTGSCNTFSCQQFFFSSEHFWLCNFDLDCTKFRRTDTSMILTFFFFFFNGCTHGIWKFQDQVLNLSHSCNAAAMLDSLTHCTRSGIEPAPPQPLEPLQSDPFFFFFSF